MNALAAVLRRQPAPATIAALAITIVAAITALLYPLREAAPDISLGVVYLLGVLVVAIVGGMWPAFATAVASALAFNFFHIPPTGRFTIEHGENWVALIVFLIAAVIASSLAEVARSRARESEERRQEADLAAELARLLLRGGRLEDNLPEVAHRLAQALHVRAADVVLGPRESEGHGLAFPLRDRTRQIGTLVVPDDLPEAVLTRIQVRIAEQLEALLGAALDREALMGDVVETAALRRSDVVKTALLRAVSHDLRTPLTGILTGAEALGSPGVTDDERRELANGVAEEANRLARLIDNLLDLSRLEADAADPRPDACSLDETIRAALDDLGPPDGAFKLSLDQDLPLIRADAAQMERAFANLLENALRYSGGHPVSVRAREVNGKVIVRIVDRGPGVPRAQLERVFEPFYRSGTEATGHRGSGLGLAIVRGFIEASGGKVWVESLPGQGATFVVELPVDAASAGVT